MPAQQVGRGAHAHQVTGFAGRQDGTDHLQHFVHFLRRLPYRQAADAVSAAVVVIQGEGVLHRLFAQIRIHAALDDGEHHLAVPVQGFRPVEMKGKTLQPALREPQGLFGIAVIGIARAAFVQGHNDIGTDDPLGLHVVFRGEGMAGTVDMRGEGAAVRRQFADGGQGENLEAAAICQDGTVPVFEPMQAARLAEGVQTGPQIEMIGIPQDDFRTDIRL